jgi:hypothetical protein
MFLNDSRRIIHGQLISLVLDEICCNTHIDYIINDPNIQQILRRVIFQIKPELYSKESLRKSVQAKNEL